MKLLLLLTALIFSNTYIHGQQWPFRLEGEITGQDSGIIELMYFLPDSSIQLKSIQVPLKKGHFEFEGRLPHPMGAYIYSLNAQKRTDLLILDTGVQKIKMHIDTFNLPPQGTSLAQQELVHGYTDTLAPYNLRLNSLMSQSAHAVSDSVDKIKNRLIEERQHAIIRYIRANPASYAAFWRVYLSLRSQGYQPFQDSCFALFSPEIKNAAGGHLFQTIRNNTRRIMPGSTFPEFRAEDMANNPVPVSRYINAAYTLVDFWFHNCPPCVAELRHFKKLYSNYHSASFQIISISTDERKDKNNLLKTIQQHNLTWPQLWDVNNLCKEYMIVAFPTNFLLDSKGTIIQRNITPEALETFLKSHLLQPE